MSDVVPIPASGVRWLHQLARARNEGDGWDEGEPYADYEGLLTFGAIERRPAAFRLSDIGLWLLSRVVPEGEHNGGV